MIDLFVDRVNALPDAQVSPSLVNLSERRPHKPRKIRQVYNRDMEAIKAFAAGQITFAQLRDAFDRQVP